MPFIKFCVVFSLILFFVLPVHFAHAAISSLSFDGTDDYIEVSDDSSLDLASSGSVELWFQKSSNVNNDWQLLVGKIGDTDAEQPWSVYLYDENNLNIVGAYFGDGVEFSGIESANNVFKNNGEWTHLVATWEDPGDDTIAVRIYVNGSEVSYSLGNIISFVSLGYTNDNPVVLGVAYTSANREFWLNSLMDEVRLYSRVLSPSEVSDHFNKTFSNNTDLEALWHFDEGSGTTASDSSGNSFDGTISGALWSTDGIDLTVPPPAASPGIISTGGTPAYRPEVTIISPQRRDLFGENVLIKYIVVDQNDAANKEWLGLGETPVTLYYSETGDMRRKKLIAKDLPAIGEYKWKTTDISDGTTYRIIVEAIDNVGEIGQKEAGAFSIDHAAPTFIAEANPPFSRGENVDLVIRSSKQLIKPPVVKVTQRSFQPILVPMEGEGNKFKGTYNVFTDYGGTAIITIEGTDNAGNIGTIITSGRTFNINTPPPSQPIIVLPLDRDIFEIENISVTGRAREDITVFLSVNGIEEYSTQPDQAGDFIFQNVKISPTFSLGNNILTIISRDINGNISDEESITVKFNIKPEVSIITPEKGTIFESFSTIHIGVRDRNNDSLNFTLEVSWDNGETWKILTETLKEEKYEWDTTEVPDGKYILRVTADDGFAKTAVLSEQFLVSNRSPVISFDEEEIIINKNINTVEGVFAQVRGASGSVAGNQEKIIIQTTTTVIEGTVNAQVRGISGFIVEVRYSLDGGKTFNKARAKDGAFDSASEDFTFTLTDLKRGLNEILIYAEDKRGFIGKGSRTIIVDLGSPPAPVITTPLSDLIVSDEDDLDKEKGGIQIEIRGRAEPDNDILGSINGRTFKGKSTSEGLFAVEAALRTPGENEIVIHTIDPAGNKSEEVKISVIYNNPPSIKLRWPRVGGGLNHIAEIVFEIQDRDLDPVIESSIGYRKLGAREVIVLARNMKENTFTWDVSDFEEGIYELVLTARDALSENILVREFYIDNTSPEILPKILLKTIFTEPTKIEIGSTAVDNFSGIEYVEYSIDSDDWFKAVITDGYQTRDADSRFKHPFILPDGRHDIFFRATDVSGNVSPIAHAQEIIIDTSSPRVGSFMLTHGPFLLFPEGDSFTVPVGIDLELTLSLERDTKDATATLGRDSKPFISKAGLWSINLSLSDVGVFPLLVSAEDEFGNTTQSKSLGNIEVTKKGRVVASDGNTGITGVAIHIFVFNEKEQSWASWEAGSYGLSNPVITSEDGSYDLLLSTGTYYLSFEKEGYERLKSSDLELLSPQFIIEDFILKPRTGLRGFLENLLEKITF